MRAPRWFTALLLLPACEGGQPDARGEAAPAKVDAPPTFARDIAPIVHRKCAGCHHEGGPAPFALTSYDEVRDHGEQIVDVTARNLMPPWLPSAGKHAFVGERERRLDAAEKSRLAAWVAAGMPAGDLAQVPALPLFPSGWQLGEPDLELVAAAAFELPAEGPDIYRNFVIAVPPGPPRFVRAVELLPGSPTIVHHAVVRVDASPDSRKLDAADPLPGYDGMAIGSARMPGGRFLGWTPGKSPTPGSDDRSWQLLGGSDLVVQVHLRPSGKPERVQPRVGLHYASKPPTTPALAMELSSTDIDIPAGARDVRVTDSLALPVDVRLVSVYPHAHYIGKRLTGYARLPDGRELELIRIENWDFDWQDEYRYAQPITLPAGSVLRMDFRYDNSADNPNNPSSPPRRVVHGVNSTDEMAELIFEVEPLDPAELGVLDAAFMAKWLDGQIRKVERQLEREGEQRSSLLTLAALLGRAKRSEAAKQRYEQALALGDDADLRVDLALVLEDLGDLPGAAAQLDAALALAPDHARAHLVRGNQQREAGSLDAALASYTRAVGSDPTLVDAHNNRGVTFEKLGRPSDAATCFARAIELEPARSLFYENLGRAREAEGRETEALAAYESALERNPGSLKALRGVAFLLATIADAKQRDPARALELAQQAGRMTNFRSPEIMEATAAALAANGRVEQARSAIDRAIELAIAAQRPDLEQRYRKLAERL